MESGTRRFRPGRIVRAAVVVVGTAGAVLLSLRGLVWLGERVPMIEEVGAPVVEGSLSRTPIRFAQTDFWFYPPRVEAELGHLKVPARRGYDDATESGIRWVRFPAVEAAESSSPIVYLAGGPGGSGIATASGDPTRLSPAT